jgi:hypothetical protein
MCLCILFLPLTYTTLHYTTLHYTTLYHPIKNTALHFTGPTRPAAAGEVLHFYHVHPQEERRSVCEGTQGGDQGLVGRGCVCVCERERECVYVCCIIVCVCVVLPLIHTHTHTGWRTALPIWSPRSSRLLEVGMCVCACVSECACVSVRACVSE